MLLRRPTVRHRRRGTLRAALAGALAVGVLAVTPGPASAAPPPNPTDGQLDGASAEVRRTAADVGRLSGLVAAAEADLEKVEVRAEAAGQAYDAAQAELAGAQADADRAATGLTQAEAAVTTAQARIAGFSHDSYVNGASLTSAAALLDSRGPGELMQRAATLDWVAANQLDVFSQLQIARVRQANADSAARAARDARAAAEAAAATAKQTADRELAAQKTAYAKLSARKSQYAGQLKAAQITLLKLQGARNAYQEWERRQQAQEAAAAAARQRSLHRTAAAAAMARAGGGPGYVLPAAGYTSSCYGARWGVTHFGVDIAAPAGTPIYAATSGMVLRAGPATGFGLAVYIRGDDGAVTVYGHMNTYSVWAGERVPAGEQIATVGARGQATGPHLHFEVHPSGAMYRGAADPAPWLRARGVPISGC